MKTNKGFSSISIILIIVAVLLVGGVAYYAKKSSNTVSQNVPVAKTISTTLPTPYISEQDNWPPLVHNFGAVYSCVPADSEMGKTAERVIDSKTYCVTTESEGAAGSTYSTYTYTIANGSGTRTTKFTLRYVQCMNYSDQQQTECQKAQADFNLDVIVDSLMK